jgi:hypothetical protein
MPEFDINDIGSVGCVRDVPGYLLPPEAWTIALNMRYVDRGLEALQGWAQVFNDPTPPIVAPHFHMSVAGPAQNFWLYTSLSKAAGYDGVTHTDLTRLAGGNYSTADSYQWNGTMLGGIAIVNNGLDVPQYWATASLATKLADLPNFSGYTAFTPVLAHNVRARVIRAFGPFLVAAHITDNSVVYPHRIRWSHPAEPGSVPSSWDVSDPTKDTGELDLPDVDSGVLVDALPLSSNMYLYKESSVWRMRFVGGQQIMDIGQSAWITTAGLLGPRCVCVSGDGQKHIFATQDDILWHNGNTVQSILNEKQRRRLQNEIDTSSFFQSFMFANPFKNEVWFCYPQSGSSYPDRALIMNYKAPGGENFTITEADGITFRWAATGNIEGFTPEIWDSGTDTWDDDTGPWSKLERRRVILSDPTASRFYKLDEGATRNGVNIVSILQRDGLGYTAKKNDGTPINDFELMKMLKRIWPKISALGGGSVDIRFGAQQTVNGPIAWGPAIGFDAVITSYADPGPVTGRAVAIELSKTGSWRIDGYKIDMATLGSF